VHTKHCFENKILNSLIQDGKNVPFQETDCNVKTDEAFALDLSLCKTYFPSAGPFINAFWTLVHVFLGRIVSNTTIEYTSP